MLKQLPKFKEIDQGYHYNIAVSQWCAVGNVIYYSFRNAEYPMVYGGRIVDKSQRLVLLESIAGGSNSMYPIHDLEVWEVEA